MWLTLGFILYGHTVSYTWSLDMDCHRSSSPLLDSVREAVRIRHYSYRTEKTYVHWVKRFVLFHGKRHPQELCEGEVGAFLSHLAVERRVAAATQNQALNAHVQESPSCRASYA